MAVITMLGATVNHKLGVWLIRLTPMAILDWIAMGKSGANNVPGIELLLRYFADLSKVFLKLLKMAMFCLVLECTVQIMGTIKTKDR
jgi:hypothetical protein